MLGLPLKSIALLAVLPTVAAGAELVLNLSASPFTLAKREFRRELGVHH